MRRRNSMSEKSASRRARGRSRRPEAEALEVRALLSITPIGQWTYSSRITYSFMPDGTSVAGTPSVLFQTLNKIAPTATWQNQIEQAATPWETNANLNLALVSDNGAPAGTSGDQQDDPRFGDIRIGAIPLSQGVLAETFLPPPSNGGTLAGDIVFNSNETFQIGGGLDLETVALHEFGHALGLPDQSTDSSSVMYYSYNAVKTSLDSTDITNIQSIYGAPQYDRFNSNGLHNSNLFTATNITPYIDPSTDQIALSGLDNTTAAQTETYVVTVPAANSGTMVVTLQSSNLSSFAPELYVFNSSLQIVGQQTAPTTYGATLTVSVPVSANQKYYIKVASAGTYGRVGAYGLELNFGNQTQAPIPPPNTLVTEQPDQGGGYTTNAMGVGGGHAGPIAWSPGLAWITAGHFTGWVERYTVGSNAPASPLAPQPLPTVPSTGIVGPVAPVGPVGPVAPPSVPTVTTDTTLPPPLAPVTPLPAPAPTIARGHGRHRPTRHAVDAPLRRWSGLRQRPPVGARIEPAPHRHTWFD